MLPTQSQAMTFLKDEAGPLAVVLLVLDALPNFNSAEFRDGAVFARFIGPLGAREHCLPLICVRQAVTPNVWAEALRDLDRSVGA